MSLGANLPGAMGAPPLLTCRLAVAAIGALPGLRVRAVSGWFRSRPVPPSDQPDFFNGVVVLEGETGPEMLLAALQALEAASGRTRSVPNAARPLDLDIVGMDTLTRTEDPILPHPRAHLRPFVLAPLAEIAPFWRHPILGRTAASLLEETGTAGLVRLSNPA